MRIGHYAPRIGAQGGIATYIRRTGRAQSERGHDVVFIGSTDEAESSQSIRHENVSNDEELFPAATELDLDVLHLHRSVAKLPEDRVPTVRTMHGHQGGCPSASRYLSRSGQPCDRSYTVAGCLWGHFVDRCGSVRPGELKHNFTHIRHEIAQADQIPTYTVSNFLREKMLAAGCSPDKLDTIHSPAPTVEHSFTPVPRDDPPRVLYLGRMVPEKGLDWLLRAVARTSEPVHLDVAGEGPQREAMEALAEDLGIRPQVSFHGWVESEQVSTLMHKARAVVFPSVWHEPAGLVSLEAAAHGRPLIASRVGGIPEYTHQDHAILTEVRNVDDLAQALDKLASTRDRANQMGRRGYEIARSDFTMSQFLDHLRNFYENAQRLEETH